MAKDLPVPEMEKLMLTNMKVTEEDLKALAAGRARAVRDYLVQSKIDPERLFIVEAKTIEMEKKEEGAKSSRADFKLK
jgi:outer membrane protein OmpA-like peptidoglycan-associated protein